VHQPAVANRSQQEWQSKIAAENAGTQIAIGERYRMAWTESDILIYAATVPESNLTFGAAIKIVKDGSGHAATGERTKVRDTYYTGRRDGAGGSSHGAIPVGENGQSN
jgi:hypothetical protein